MRKNIYLVGFMGTGKSTIGRELAKVTGRRFIDMDTELEKRLNMSVNKIFDTEGEEFFRDRERELAFELIEKSNYVVSTGGGTIMDEEIYAAFKSSGIMICLVADRAELIERLKRTSKRPHLRVSDIDKKVEELLRERGVVFDSVPIKINTSDMTPMEVVSKLVKLFKIRQNILDKLTNQQIEIT